jgi:HEAT repeat protein
VALSAAFLLVVASYISFWDLHTPMGLGVFGLLLVAVSLFVSIRVDAITLARRQKRGKKQLLNRSDARSRLVKFVLGGVLIPIGALAAANLVELPNNRTPMSLAIRFTVAKPEVSRAEQLGNAVLRAESPATKVQGILALQTLSSAEALDQLLRFLSDDPMALNDGSEYQALSKALASYGVQARPKLLQRFSQFSPSLRRGAAGPGGDLFERHFSAAFDGLKSEIAGRNADPAAKVAELARLQAAQADLQRALSQVETYTRASQGSSSLPAFIMQTFLQMGLKQDADLLAFARQTAADATWSDAVRGQALLLIAKVGTKDDLDGLYAYLESPSRLLQARAIQAIAALQSKVSATGTNG